MQSTGLKRFIYGIMYLIIFGGLGYGIYAVTLQPAPSCFDNKQNQGETDIDCGGSNCQPCDAKNFQPINIAPVALINVGGTSLSAVIRLSNPNTSYGANKFTYTLKFFDSNGTIVDSVTNDSFIYPGEIKTIIEAGLNIDPGLVSSASVEVSNLSLKSIADFALPKIQTRDIKIELRHQDSLAVISGVLVNQNAFVLSQAVINVVIANELGVKVGASKTLAENIQPFTEQQFRISVPSIDLAVVTLDQIEISVAARQ